VLTALVICTGFLVTHILAHRWPFTVEDQVVLALVEARGPARTTLAHALSSAGSTAVIVGLTAIIAVGLRVGLARWRESLFLATAVSEQGLVFLLTTIAVDRARPAVLHLDVSPPTSSFPSGHTSAAVALYVGIALLLASHIQRRTWRVTACVAMCTVPVAVAISRLYLGMHHPSDAVASLGNGGGCLWIMRRAWLAPGGSVGAGA
jgi:membrane-associated phospholipid phosphatase